MKEVLIIDGVRTPIGSYGGSLAAYTAEELAAIVLKALVAKTKIDTSLVEDVLMGVALSFGAAPNIARWAVLKAGLPLEVPGQTIERQCGSSLQALNTAAAYIRAGFGEVYIAGGCESHTRKPYMIEKPSSPFSVTPPQWVTLAAAPAKEMAIGMGEAAEVWAERYGISREEQDVFGLRSQQRALKAIDSGYFKEEIVPVPVPQRKGEPIIFDRDEHPRVTSMEKLSALRTPFKEKGTVTAGNSSGVNDGAVALLLMSAEKCVELGYTPLGRFVDCAVVANDPRDFGIAPVKAIKKVLGKAGLKLDQMDVVECNEAFAAQTLACIKLLEADGYPVDLEKWNRNGGAIAFGHPNGMSGGRLAISVLRELARVKGRYGLATLCVGGGQAVATIFERC